MQIEMAGVSDNLSPYLMPMMDKINESASIMGQDSAQDPVMKLQNMGNTMIESVTIIWVLVMAVATAASFAASGIPFFAFGTALTNLFLFFVPIFMAILGSLFIQGSILAVYVPLIPFIVFTFTALGWFALVVETMVAGPIVCLGMTHPEGHDLLGASQQGIILLLSVFLRPVLMIIGLVAGMLLSRIGLNYLDVGFMLVTNSSESLGILTFFSMMYIYCALVMMVVHTAYGLIYQVPSKVMRWIGLSDQVGQEATEALGKSTQGAQTGSQALSEFQGRGVEASKGFGGSVGKNVMDTQKEGDKAHAKLQKSQQGNNAQQNPAGGGNPGIAQGAGNVNPP
jgi:conjugal transfer/type IV secretion protein DotA/TraY